MPRWPVDQHGLMRFCMRTISMLAGCVHVDQLPYKGSQKYVCFSVVCFRWQALTRCITAQPEHGLSILALLCFP